MQSRLNDKFGVSFDISDLQVTEENKPLNAPLSVYSVSPSQFPSASRVDVGTSSPVAPLPPAHEQIGREDIGSPDLAKFPVHFGTPTGDVFLQISPHGATLNLQKLGSNRARTGSSQGSTSLVQECRFRRHGEPLISAFSKTTNSETLGSEHRGANPISARGIGEAAILALGLPYTPVLHDYGWLQRDNHIARKMDPWSKPKELKDETILPQLMIIMEHLDPNRVMLDGVFGSYINAAWAEYRGREKSYVDLVTKEFALDQRNLAPTETNGDTVMLAALWMYFQSKLDFRKHGWNVRDYDLGKNFTFDVLEKRFKVLDLGVADAISEEAERVVDNMVGKDLMDPYREEGTRLARILEEARAQRARIPRPTSLNEVILDTPRKQALFEIGHNGFFGLLRVPHNLQDSGRPTGEGLSPLMEKFVNYMWANPNVDNLESAQREIGTFILRELGSGSLAEEIIDNSTQQEGVLRKG